MADKEWISPVNDSLLNADIKFCISHTLGWMDNQKSQIHVENSC